MYLSVSHVVVVLFRVIKCPRLPEESRKRKEREERRARGEDGTGSNLELNNTDNHLMPRGTSPYEGNVDQPLVPPGNVDLPLTPPYQQPPQDLNVVYNPSATNYQQPPPSATQSNRYSYDPSNTVELRYIRSRTTSEMGRDSYYDHHGEAPPTNDDSSHPIVSTSTRI